MIQTTKIYIFFVILLKYFRKRIFLKMRDLVLMIGTNLGDRESNISTAIHRLNAFFGSPKLIGAIYETEPWGYDTDKMFYNRAVVYTTDLLPFEILHVCKSVEIEMGRRKTFDRRYENRIIDVDIILYGELVVNELYLKIPHHQLTERRFVLEPLNDIIPDFMHPVLHKTVRQLYLECTDSLKVKKIDRDNYGADLQHNIEHIYSYIAIEGCIGAGKTSLSTRIAKDLNAKLILEQFADNPFLPMFYADKDKYAFPVELSFLAARYRQLTDNLINMDLFHNLVVSDYFLSKSYIFAGKTLSDDLFRLYSVLFNIIKTKLPEPDLLVYLHLPVENLQSNIRKRGRSYERNISDDYLQSIQDGYLDFFRQESGKRIVIVNTSSLDFVNNDGDYRYMLDIISHEWPMGITRI